MLGPVVISVTAGIVVLLAGLLVNGCRISKLLGGGRSSSDSGNSTAFAVTPLEIRDSALVGSTVARTATLDISGGGWTSTTDNDWIVLRPARSSSHGTARVSLDPKALPPGMHKGAVTLQRMPSGSGPATSAAVAVSFFIQQPILKLSSDGFSYTAKSTEAVFYDTVEVTNAGSGPLTWTAKVEHNSGWITLGATSGNGPGVIPFRIAAAGLTYLGTFRDTVVVEAPGAKNSPGTVGITLRRRRGD